jgi:hypothetical protein
MPKSFLISLLLCLFLLGISVSAQIGPVIQRNPTVRFAVIGDYGDNSPREAEVAALVQRLEPDFVITTGDNNYPAGQQQTIDENIGQYYSSFISHYIGDYGQGAVGENRFFPALGNHDWQTDSVKAFTDYFILPNNERYYEFPWGPVRLFALDSDPHEPDGYDSQSLQAQWLEERLAAATEPWRIVYMHHPAYSSARPYATDSANWPYAAWGASAVISGHAHVYERLNIGGLTYIVNGLGGANPYNFDEAMEGSQFRFHAAHGAMLLEVTETSLTMNFYGIYGRPIASSNTRLEAGQWIEFDISQVVSGDGSYSFVLDGTVSDMLAFGSLESGENPPQLVLDIAGSDEPMSFMASEDASVDLLTTALSVRPDAFLQLIRTKTEHQRIYLQFQLSAIGSPIEGASLRLYLESADPEAQGGIALYRADSSISWTDETLNRDNAPAILIDNSPIDSFSLP